jgi:hypothetical protein
VPSLSPGILARPEPGVSVFVVDTVTLSVKATDNEPLDYQGPGMALTSRMRLTRALTLVNAKEIACRGP